ncbi:MULTISPECIES: 4-hydroxythreonine-4-phosphate dehydrogenase PdxA [Nonlabens]|uniref:4-hydroxythreonine-4-phosphate dehydrogenase n=1 Tax=Nonlabens xylanidelens TaxID=191564 RepID=A0A2S6IQP4_9FLAO|nr:4-hydroxythreonine-4-phosphate dehydrogenase PdxA [Nonlabens xylanidelens]PPK96491.1 4-hydroxythreonine-4-phosphate dehydrogenase [Nonlabens xylanidelens]PQJ18209.1 4-hydroxythreonine-4-phosphate dehydrogenase PdxA [Nonlabens xylanidelens]
MNKEENIKVGITIGDPNGIGGEVILKAFEDSRMLEMFTPVVFASTKLLSYYVKTFNLKVKIHGITSLNDVVPGKLNVFRLIKEPFKVNWGEVSPEAGEIAVRSLEAATAALKNKDIDVLVTAPINKESIHSDKFKFPGHTDYLNQELEGESLMFMVSNELRVGLLTDHVPVKDVPASINAKVIKTKIGTIKESLKKDFGISRPKIAVLGINPHVGDNGVIGTEDQDTLIPALEQLREDGNIIFGPYAADSFFGNKKYKEFDAILASYHDQGLIPFKTIAFGSGVNFTAGLSHVRTSPDHGTGFDIAGKGEANPDSFIAAINYAIEIYRKRKEYDILNKNPLKKLSRKRR